MPKAKATPFSKEPQKVESHPTSVRFSAKLKADMAAAAAKRGCSVAWLIVDTMTRWVEWYEREGK